MTWRFGTASDIAGRGEQEDRVEIIASPDRESYLLVVADGMGGYQDGGRAAQAVIDTAKSSRNVRSWLRNHLKSRPQTSIFFQIRDVRRCTLNVWRGSCTLF